MHAYLILAHNNFEQLGRLISMIDDERNEIYIHIDLKSEFSEKDKSKLVACGKRANIFFVPRVRVSWGGYSQVEAELSLLVEATKVKHEYYHLISGADLPIKSQNYIHSFFDSHLGTEFIHFGDSKWIDDASARLKYYWLFQEWVGHSHRLDKKLLKIVARVIVYIQKIIHINRLESRGRQIKFSAGSNWFSITDDFARYIVSNREKIFGLLSHTICSDEELVQIMAVNSSFISRCFSANYDGDYKSIMRLIDWNRGRPYIWRKEDYEEIIASDCLFARKFDYGIDSEIIDKIEKYVKAGLGDEQ